MGKHGFNRLIVGAAAVAAGLLLAGPIAAAGELLPGAAGLSIIIPGTLPPAAMAPIGVLPQVPADVEDGAAAKDPTIQSPAGFEPGGMGGGCNRGKVAPTV